MGLAFYTYGHDYRSELPVYSYGTSVGNFGHVPFWHQTIAPYLSREDTDRFGYLGPDPEHDFMPCPSRQRPEGISANIFQTYGTSYPTIFGFYAPPENVPRASLFGFNGSARLDKIPPSVFIVSEGRNQYGGYRTELHNPLASGSWSATYDYDRDGQNDSNPGEVFFGVGPYNGVFPVHNETANFLHTDGAVLRIHIREWARRAEQRDTSFFGVGLPDNLSKYK